MTNKIVTLYYKPPEILLGCKNYNMSVDMWGVGCILAELAINKKLFKGKSEIDQLFKIYKYLGSPSHDYWPEYS